MRTPITYYGGKQKLAKTILSLIPEHNLYCEPFFGGGAVFFSKQPSNVEIINDTNSELINFYKVVKNDFVSLEKEIAITLHSRDLHRKANVIYNNPDMFSDLKRAWVLSTQSFSSKLDGSWGYDIKKPQTSKRLENRKNEFTIDMAIRLQQTQIECNDALRIISSRDRADSFFYLDPPYFNSNCGHYVGYTKEDFEMLLKQLSKLEGKFLLSSYPSPILKKYARQFGWHQIKINQTVSVANKGKHLKKKVETLSANYPIE